MTTPLLMFSWAEGGGRRSASGRGAALLGAEGGEEDVTEEALVRLVPPEAEAMVLPFPPDEALV